MGGQVLGAGQGVDVPRHLRQCLAVVLDDVDAAQERLHARLLRGVHVIAYTEEALRDVAAAVLTLAAAEDLPAHGQAVSRRFG